MELEEALRDGCKTRGVPREVNTYSIVKIFLDSLAYAKI